jgi:hypothetical protein
MAFMAPFLLKSVGKVGVLGVLGGGERSPPPASSTSLRLPVIIFLTEPVHGSVSTKSLVLN